MTNSDVSTGPFLSLPLALKKKCKALRLERGMRRDVMKLCYKALRSCLNIKIVHNSFAQNLINHLIVNN